MKKVVIPWDIGGPLRDSSKQMHRGHTRAIAFVYKAAPESLKQSIKSFGKWMIRQDEYDTWKLFGLTQNLTKGEWGEKLSHFWKGDYYKSRDYIALMLTAYLLYEKGFSIKDVFSNEKPVEFLANLLLSSSWDESLLKHVVEAGACSKKMFKTEKIVGFSKLSKGAIDAIRLLAKNGALQGILTAAPSGSTEGWIKKFIYPNLDATLISSPDLFPPEFVAEGIIDKAATLAEMFKKAKQKFGDIVFAYIADTASDIRAFAEAIKELVKEFGEVNAYLLMVRNGMGVENEWKNALAEATLNGEPIFGKYATLMIGETAYPVVKQFVITAKAMG